MVLLRLVDDISLVSGLASLSCIRSPEVDESRIDCG